MRRGQRRYWSTLGLFESRLTRSFGKGGVWLAGDAAHQAPPVAVHSMNSGLLEARELASRISQIQRAAGAPSLLEQFATEMHETWERLLEADRVVRALPGADPWVRQNGARILACLPASGEGSSRSSSRSASRPRRRARRRFRFVSAAKRLRPGLAAAHLTSVRGGRTLDSSV